jgi:hypothetical protein
MRLMNRTFSLRPAPHRLFFNNQKSAAFLLENLRPFQQCFRARRHRIAWRVVSRSGQEAFAGAFVIGAGSHRDLEQKCCGFAF